MEIATYQKAKKGNYYSGDSFFYEELEDGFICALADGLGSGEIAMNSSEAAIEVIKNNKSAPLDDLVDLCNKAMAGTNIRGCVLGILRVDYVEQSYAYSSLGNISVIMVAKDGKKERNIPVPGYLSGVPHKVKVHNGPLEEGSIFFMFSDGVDEHQLTKEFYNHRTMDLTVDWYKRQENKMNDDTTLIAMKYKGEVS